MQQDIETIIGKLKYFIEDVSLGNTTSTAILPDNRIIDDLGLDSLDFASVLLACEQWLGIKVQEREVDWRTIQTVRELAQFLYQQQ